MHHWKEAHICKSIDMDIPKIAGSTLNHPCAWNRTDRKLRQGKVGGTRESCESRATKNRTRKGQTCDKMSEGDMQYNHSLHEWRPKAMVSDNSVARGTHINEENSLDTYHTQDIIRNTMESIRKPTHRWIHRNGTRNKTRRKEVSETTKFMGERNMHPE